VVGKDEKALHLFTGALLMVDRNFPSQTGIHEIVLFESTTGVVDSIDPVRVGKDALVRAENVVIDLSGAVKRRDGMVELSSANCHSLFSCGEYGLGVLDGVLKLIEKDFSLTSLISVVGSGKLSYALGFDGSYDVVFFCNGVMNGKVVNKVYSAWTTSSYVGVNSTEEQVIEYLASPPVGSLLEIFNGRMLVAVDNLVYVSEVFDYSRFKVIPFIFESAVVMMKGLTGGMYIGTEKEVLFLSGTDPFEFSRVKVMDGRVISGSCYKVTASDIGLQAQAEVIVFSVSGEGICLGDGSGNVQNLTKVEIDFSDEVVGACCVTNDKQYIVSMGV
jgi:hypothetical protein